MIFDLHPEYKNKGADDTFGLAGTMSTPSGETKKRFENMIKGQVEADMIEDNIKRQ